MVGEEPPANGPAMGVGEHRYVPVSWPTDDPSVFANDVAGVAVDTDDSVITFSRDPTPLRRFTAAGKLVARWGEGVFSNPHGIHLSPDGFHWCTDDGDHTVRKLTSSGTPIMELGTQGEPAPFMGGAPFRRCTQAAVSSSGEIFVSDGYGNARIHRFSATGEFIASFGGPGVLPGEFNLPHSLVCQDDQLYVCDRENNRIQIFALDGTLVDQWYGVHRPSVLAPLPDAGGGWVIGELGPMWGFSRGAPNLGPRLTILSAVGEVVARIAAEPAAGTGPGQFIAPHGLAIDSSGAIYVAQVVEAGWPLMFPDVPLPRVRPSVVKLARL